IIADTSFAILSLNETYYVGNPFEIFFYWNYIFFAFAAYRGIKSPEILESLLQRADTDSLRLKLSPKSRIILTIVTATVCILLVIITLNSLRGTFLSPNEEQLITSILYASLLLVAITTVIGILFWKKRSSLIQTTQLTEKLPSVPNEMARIEKQISSLETRSKKNSKITVLGIIILASSLLTYLSLSVIVGPQTNLPTGRFVIENLKGDKISTWVTWHIPKDEQLQVTIINSQGLSDERINTIKEAIVSEKSIMLENSFVNKYPPNEKSVFYEGWEGALKSIAGQKTEYSIPTNFVATTSEKSIGDIIIILSTGREADNTYGFTRSIADEKSNQILKSFITIYNTDNLNQIELAAIVRHEFGHALGLVHSTDSEDLMFPIFHSTHAVISECDLDAIISLYNGIKSTEVVCRH
ncbi:MAG: matrixin family metalloprotease, partial [Thaumarchaeota archaeon]|nr:matrixin family metalloprotease [Nitrososphaerota archaeon]